MPLSAAHGAAPGFAVVAVRPHRPARLTTGVAAVRSTVLIDVVICISLFAVALIVRWPNLLLSPQFSSVGATIRLALDIADGRAYPLADQAPYLGTPFIYLLGAVYRLFGPSVESSLAVPWLIGGLTVIPTYLLGREIGGRAAGLVAATLLAASAAHTVITSHVPLSHSLTPLFATVTLWLAARASRRGEGWSLALAGLGVGLSLQTHPSVAPLLLGAGVGIVLHRPSWLRSRWPYLAAVLALLGYSTLLADQVRTRFAVVADVQAKQARYLDADIDQDEDPNEGVYVNNVEQLALSLVRLSSGALLDRPTAPEYLRDPRELVYPILAVGGMVLAVARGDRLLAPALVAAILISPVFSGKYKPILDGRYLMPLLPVLLVGIGQVFAEVDRRVGPGVWRRGVGIAVLGLALWPLVAVQLQQLDTFYRVSQESGFSNTVYLRTMAQVTAARVADEAVVLDADLLEVKTPGGGKASNTFTWLFAVTRVPTETWSPDDGVDRLIGRLVILRRTTAERLDGRVALQPINGQRLSSRDRPNYRAYRVGECSSNDACSSRGGVAPLRKDDP